MPFEPIDTGFEPSGARAVALDAAMRARLADSVAAIRDAAAGCGAPVPGDFDLALAKLRSEPANPALFALYHDMAVFASQDDLASAGP